MYVYVYGVHLLTCLYDMHKFVVFAHFSSLNIYNVVSA